MALPPAADKIFCNQIPVVVLEDLLRHRAHSSRDFGTGTMLTVPRSWWVLRPVTPNVEYDLSAEFSGGCPRIARGADALVVGNEQRIVRRVQHNRARRIADRDHAQDGRRSSASLRSTTAIALAL